MRDILIGIDAGTSVIKSVAFDLSGRQLAMTAVPNSYEAVGRTGSVQELRRTWTDTVKTLAELSARIENLPGRVAAIAVTGQGDGTWMIDGDGEPVGKGWLWLDARASAVVERLRAESGDAERFARTGSGLAACQQGPQLRWMKDHAPEMLEGAATAFHCKDWLYFNLTDKRATDPSEANFTFGDFRTRQYCDDVIDFLGLKDLKHLLPEIVDGATTHHPLSAAAAAAAGLPAGTPVVLGYVDVVCTALGAGLYEPGTDAGCSIIGSTGMHMRLAAGADDVRLNQNHTGYTMCMPIPNTYAQMQSNMAATLNIDWILQFAGDLLKGMGIEKSKSDLLAHVDHWLAEAKENSASLPSLYFGGRGARSLRRCRCPRVLRRPFDQSRLRRHGACRVRRSRLCCAGLLRRNGAAAGTRAFVGRGGSQRLVAAHSRWRSGRQHPDERTRGGRCRRCGYDRSRFAGNSSHHGRLRSRMGSAASPAGRAGG